MLHESIYANDHKLEAWSAAVDKSLGEDTSKAFWESPNPF